ncbi:MAG TPA: protein kinase [Gemmatimonadaceae bacterium]|nr:protein kinase [Gemmatimonadaceae bacterium]
MTVLRDELQRTLGTSYTLERELGGGGMSSVFVARDNALGRAVVVKVLPYELAAAVSVDRFKREIMLSAALQHPHIVPVLTAGEIPADASVSPPTPLPYFIMPFVEGESLRTRLERGPLSVRETVTILKDVARALAYAHGRGVIHRDIKPDNILLTTGSATVTDFGVAKALTASRETRRPLPQGNRSGTITIVGTSIGTPAYMAPEQAAGDPSMDHRADLYALGIVGYEMLVGTPPFHGRPPQQLLAAHLTEKPSPIGSRRYDVPAALNTLLMQLLEKEPNKRPKAAAEVVRSLEDPAVVSGTFTPPALPSAKRPKRVLWALAGAGILASVAAGGAWFTNRKSSNATDTPSPALTTPAPAGKSIAVIPLVNISRDTSDAYFAAGMSSDLSNAISRIPGVRVAGSQSISHDASASPIELGKSLGVNMVLTGTVQRDKSRLRVTARLVNTSDGFTVWSDMFERDSKDLFKVQDEISGAIVAAISPELSGAGAGQAATPAPAASSSPTPASASSAPHGTSDLLAYDLYLRGRYFFDKRGEVGLRRALDYFQQATQRDSNFARAYAGIANAYALLPLYANVRVDSLMPLAMSAIDRAIRLDSTLAESFASRATLLQAAWRWSEAERDYKRALTLDPNAPSTHQWYGELLLVLGRTPEAKAQLARAAQLDPLAPVTLGSYAFVLTIARQPDSAIAAAKRAVELDSTLVVTRFILGTVYLQAGRLPDAVRELEASVKLDSSSTRALGLLGYAYAKSGKTRQANDLAKSLENQVGRSAGAATAAARVYLGLGDRGRALTLLERAATDRDSFYSSESLAENFFDPIRADPRFAAIVSRVGVGAGLAK